MSALPGYVVSTMVRGLRELAGDREPVEGFKRTLGELSVAELDQAILTFAQALDLARERRAFYRTLSEAVDTYMNQTGAPRMSSEEAAERLGLRLTDDATLRVGHQRYAPDLDVED